MIILKRKFRSAIWHFNNWRRLIYHSTIQFVVELITERYWFLDYLPILFKKRSGVLLLKLDLIGDFVVWLDSAQAYRRLYPDHKITLAVNSATTDLAAMLPYWDEVISIKTHELRTDYLYRGRILSNLRKRNFAIAVQPTFSREYIGDLALRATNAPLRIGYTGDTHNISDQLKLKTDAWYTNLIPRISSDEMELSVNANFIRHLGYKDFLSSAPRISLIGSLPPGFQLDKPLVLVSPGASWEPRRWPVERFATLILNLLSEFDLQIVLTGSAGEKTVCDALENLVASKSLTNFAGKTNLTTLVELTRAAKLVIANESSPIHMATATGTPSVCITGGGHFGRFVPYRIESIRHAIFPTIVNVSMDCYGCNWNCPFVGAEGLSVPCISRISVDSVTHHCVSILSRDDIDN